MADKFKFGKSKYCSGQPAERSKLLICPTCPSVSHLVCETPLSLKGKDKAMRKRAVLDRELGNISACEKLQPLL